MNNHMSVGSKEFLGRSSSPVFDSDLFGRFPESRFATINLGSGLYPEGVSTQIFSDYLRFRKWVYVDQRRFLSKSNADSEGREFDDSDLRSGHVAIMENRGSGRAAFVACMRIIKRGNEELPIEKDFPEAFKGGSVDESSIEVSRFISVARSARVMPELLSAMLAIVHKDKLGPVYGMVESNLENHIKNLGLSSRRIAEPKELREYNDTVNAAVEIDLSGMKSRIGEEGMKASFLADGEVKFWGEFLNGRDVLRNATSKRVV